MEKDILAVQARYIPPQWGEGGIVAAHWVEASTEQLPEGSILVARQRWIAIPVIGRMIHYEDLLECPMVVVEALVAVLPSDE